MPISVELKLLCPPSYAEETPDLFSMTFRFAVRVEGREAVVEARLGDIYNGVTRFFPEPGRLQTSHKRLKHASMKQERESAEAVGGRRQSGSGARPGHKGDGRVRGRYRIENKLTTAVSHRVRLTDLRKIRAECEGLEVPIYDIQFKETGTLRTIDNWVLMPRRDWEKLVNAQAVDD